MKKTTKKITDKTWAILLKQAQIAAKNAYAPYSGFHVGTAMQLSDGTIVAGCNIENISNGATVCAERGALQTAVAKLGGDKVFVDCIAVITPSKEPTFPCGICRQALGEFIPNPSETIIRAYSQDAKKFIEVSFEEIAPKLFTRFNSQKYVNSKK